MVNRIVAYVHAYAGMGRNAGAETTLHDMLKYLVENGWEAVVIVSQPYPGMSEYTIEGVQVIPQESKRTILHWIPQADVVITHLECSERSTLLAKKYRIPVIQLIHNNMDITKGYVGMNPDMAVYNTEWVKKTFDFHGLSIVVHPAVRAKDYAALDPVSQKRQYVTLVNLWDRKGASVFYECAAALPKIKFLGVKGGYGLQDVRDLPNVTIVENTNDMASIYAQTKIILMPSKYESFGRVAVEAASQGIPSIVADTPGLREALVDGGTFVPDGDVQGYVDYIKRLQHWKSYDSASARARKRFSELEDRSALELRTFLIHCESLAATGKLLRGW